MLVHGSPSGPSLFSVKSAAVPADSTPAIVRDNAADGPFRPSEPPLHERQLRILLWLVAVGFFMQTLDATIVNTALPAMANSLQTNPLHMQSVLVVYSLTMAMLIPVSGWVADRFGTCRVYMGAILVFVLGSLLCGLSANVAQLVAARVVQGAGGALLLPVGRLAVLRAYPRERFLTAMSFVAIPGLIGPLLGPALGGWLVQVFSWHWIFSSTCRWACWAGLPRGATCQISAVATCRHWTSPAMLCWHWGWRWCRFRWTCWPISSGPRR